jgi:hypothetical protein
MILATSYLTAGFSKSRHDQSVYLLADGCTGRIHNNRPRPVRCYVIRMFDPAAFISLETAR